jgi:hypothetical protein
MQQNAANVVRQTCLDIERDAEMNAHVITGAMRSSVYVIVQGVGGRAVLDNYIQSATQARGARPSAFIEQAVLPEQGKIQGVVGVSVNYAQYEENRAAHQFLLPAAMRNEPRFNAAMANIANNV